MTCLAAGLNPENIPNNLNISYKWLRTNNTNKAL